MSQPFLAEIKMGGMNFAPRNYAFCSGQILGIAQNTALFSLLGTTYGGNGQTTFALPDLRGRAPLHHGNGAGLTPRFLGETGGEETVTLLPTELPSHTHPAQGDDTAGGDISPAGHTWGKKAARTPAALYSGAPSVAMNPSSISPAGGGQPHNNLAPFLAINFFIAVAGIFPSRN